MTRLAAFVSGAVLLGLEIAASRVLAPAYGSSVQVWGSLLGVFLAGLSLGYALGGRWADRSPTARAFAAVQILAAASVAAVPFLAPPALAALFRFGPLAGASTLFLLPSVLLGAVTPFAVRLEAGDASTAGRTAGRLYAVGTLGSIAGALGVAFVLLDRFGVRAILFQLAAVQAALGAASCVPWKGRGAAAALLAVSAWGMASEGPRDPSVLWVKDTAYHRITVSEEGGLRTLRFDHRVQTVMDPEDPLRSALEYYDLMQLPWALRPGLKRVALLGLGGGVLARQYLARDPVLRVEVAELDPEVTEAARRFFGLPTDPRLEVRIGDARAALRGMEGGFDAILVDLFQESRFSFHVATRESLEAMRGKLSPGGLVVQNLNGSLEGESSRLFRAVLRTYREAFPTVYVFANHWPDRGGPHLRRNLLIVATGAPRLEAEEILRRAEAISLALARAAGDLVEAPIPTDDVPALTDDYAPVDGLLVPPPMDPARARPF